MQAVHTHTHTRAHTHTAVPSFNSKPVVMTGSFDVPTAGRVEFDFTPVKRPPKGTPTMPMKRFMRLMRK